jgi:thiamine transport system ATP-binding protein
MLEVVDVTIERGGVAVVVDLSLEVAGGEVVALLGPSGAGKSSLLLAVAGLVDVTQGSVRIAGHDVAGQPPHRRGVGLVFQEYALFPHMDVLANLVYGLHGDGRSAAEHEAVARRWLTRVGLPPEQFADRDVATLSGGQRQRVALARSLAPDPAVLLLDEPLGSLDRQLREELLDELSDVVRREDGPAVVAVTHDRDEAFTLGDRVGVLREGRMAALARPAELWAEPGSAWLARFLGHDNVLEPLEARLLGLDVGGPVAIPAHGLRLTDAPGPGSDAGVGRVVGAAWRDGRRRLRVEVGPSTRVVVEVHAGDHHDVGDPVTVLVDEGHLTAL